VVKGRGGLDVDEWKWVSNPVENTTNLFLYGNHPLSFDEKCRLTMPIEIRDSLDVERDGNAFFVVEGVNRRLWLWPDRMYRSMVSKLSSEMAPGHERLEFEHLNFGLADRQEIDKQNRIRIPEKRVKEAGLGKEIILIGVRDHLEIWKRPDWDFYIGMLKDRGSEIASKNRQSERQEKV
jgi:MraZ protein